MTFLAKATTAIRRVVDIGLLALIVVVLLAVVLAKGTPLVGRVSIVIGGGSMEPTIHLGSAIVVKPVAPADLVVGDVVSMQVGAERATYTHRVVAVVDRPDGRWIRTQGDANAAPDPTLVPASAVIGRVELSIPLIGYLMALLSLPVGVIFVLGLAATLLAIAWLLESLEPEPLARRLEPDARHATAGEPAADPATTHGEPISARPIRAGLPRSGGLATAFGGLGGPPQAPVGRPTVRQQLDRQREVRRRRARWQRAGDGRPAD